MKPSVGCFFGSFNPVHLGHVQVVQNCIKKLKLDEVLVIVSPLNPLKHESLIPPIHRLELTKLAFEGASKVTVSDIEFDMPKPSYTIHTIKTLINKFPNKRLVLIIGQDHVVNFHLWKNYTQILDLIEVYAHTRELSSDVTTSKMIHKISLLTFDSIPISSTQVRDLIAENSSFEHLVPTRVAHYINTNRLYR